MHLSTTYDICTTSRVCICTVYLYASHQRWPVPSCPIRHLHTSKASIHDNTDTRPQSCPTYSGIPQKVIHPPENSQRKPSEKMMLGGVLLSFLVALFVPFSGAKLLNFRGVLFATELGVPPIQNGDTLIYEHNFPSWIEIQSTIPSGKRCCNSRTKIGHWSHTKKSISIKSYSL